MKTLKIGIVFICMLALPACGMWSTSVRHEYTALTNVELSQKNFVVLGPVEGVAQEMYILGFGGMSKQLYGKAKNDMIRKANLKGRARAIVDVTYEKHTAFYLVAHICTVTATGTLVEFTR
jgi:hypothetical protein